jgi:polar amino acid transport system substrate-binding protein
MKKALIAACAVLGIVTVVFGALAVYNFVSVPEAVKLEEKAADFVLSQDVITDAPAQTLDVEELLGKNNNTAGDEFNEEFYGSDEYDDEDLDPDGFDMALIKAIGEKLGVEVEIQNMEFGSLITSIGSKIDIAIAGMTVTDERKNAVDFSEPYYDAVQYVILPADSAIAAKEDLLGKTIGCQLGTTREYLIDDIIAEDGATQKKSYNKAVDAVNDLLNGRLDCVIIDRNPAMVFQSNYPDQIKLSDGADFGFEAEQYAIAMPKGDTALVEQVNAALAELKSDGTFDKLVEQYIEN